MEPPEPTKLMLSRAVASSRRHGINLVPERLNPASGNCSFEAVLFNNNDRSCFDDKYTFSVDYYRRIWMTDMEARVLDNNEWNCGYTATELKAGFAEVKESGVYERGLFGDLILPGIAVGVHKRILIFNTNPNTPHDPVSVVCPKKFGGYTDSEIPLVLAYNLVHFESMHPSSREDIERTVNLTDSYLDGNYNFGHDDIHHLIEVEETEADDMMYDCDVKCDDENSFSFSSFGKTVLMTMDEQGFIQCPVCNKNFQRIRPHLKSNKTCSKFINFEAFEKGFNTFDSTLKKSKEREKKAAMRKRQNLEGKKAQAEKDKKRMKTGREKRIINEKEAQAEKTGRRDI